MKKNAKLRKANSSNLGECIYRPASGLWCQSGPQGWLVAGPDGVFAAGYSRQPLVDSQFSIRAGKSSAVATVEFNGQIPDGLNVGAGDIKLWQLTQQRALGALWRSHPGWLRPNYYWGSGGWGYEDQANGVRVERQRSLFRVEFKKNSNQRSSIWARHPAAERRLMDWTDFLVGQVLLPAAAWEDPRPWLDFKETFKLNLSPAAQQRIEQKLIRQYKNDHSSVSRRGNADSLDGAQKLQQEFTNSILQIARQAWWAAHPSVLAQLKLGQPATAPAGDLDLAWFKNFMPIEDSEGPRVWPPLSIAESLNLLNN